MNTTTIGRHKADLADQALDAFDTTSGVIRTATALCPDGLPPRADDVRQRIRDRGRELAIATSRVTAVLCRIEGQR